ncbi:MAG: hypothetical protein ACW99F_13460 [Candidatus Hodarchaeales archaeon]
MLDIQHEFLFDHDSDFDKLKREYESLYIAYITTLEEVLRSQSYALRIAKDEIEPPVRTKEEQIKHLEEKIRGLNQQKLSADIAKRRSNG